MRLSPYADNIFATYRNASSGLQEFLSFATPTRYKKGECIFPANTHIDHLYYLEKGEAYSMYTHLDGRQSKVYRYAAHTVMGDTHFFLRRPSMLSFHCAKSALVWAFDRQTLEEHLFPQNPHLLYELAVFLSYRNSMQGNLMLVQTYDPLLLRICTYIAMHAKRSLDGVITATLPTTKQGLARLFGVHRISICRELKKMTDEGVLEEQGNKTFIVVNEAAFANLLGKSVNHAHYAHLFTDKAALLLSPLQYV